MSRMAVRPSIAAVSSILLLVVCAALPPSSTTCPSGVAITTPQPPGPGLPFAAPSQKTTIRSPFIAMNVSSLTHEEDGRSGALVCRDNRCGRAAGADSEAGALVDGRTDPVPPDEHQRKGLDARSGAPGRTGRRLP